jgi:hypothetical protein
VPVVWAVATIGAPAMTAAAIPAYQLLLSTSGVSLFLASARPRGRRGGRSKIEAKHLRAAVWMSISALRSELIK